MCFFSVDLAKVAKHEMFVARGGWFLVETGFQITTGRPRWPGLVIRWDSQWSSSGGQQEYRSCYLAALFFLCQSDRVEDNQDCIPLKDGDTTVWSTFNFPLDRELTWSSPAKTRCEQESRSSELQ